MDGDDIHALREAFIASIADRNRVARRRSAALLELLEEGELCTVPNDDGEPTTTRRRLSVREQLAVDRNLIQHQTSIARGMRDMIVALVERRVRQSERDVTDEEIDEAVLDAL